MRWFAGLIVATAFVAACDTARADGVSTPVPSNMQGVWAKHGRCDVMAERLTIYAKTAGYGTGPFVPINYDPQSAAIEWAEKGVVDNFVAGSSPDILIHNTQGFHMPGQEGMARCRADLASVPWPPADAQTSDPFEYKLEVTPEEGPVDQAIESRYTMLFDDCQKRAQITQENAACLEAEFVRQDAALNKAWKAALGRLPAATHAPLLKAQRKWIAARDPFCRAESDGPGTIAPVEYVGCRVELTIRRTIWLEHLH